MAYRKTVTVSRRRYGRRPSTWNKKRVYRKRFSTRRPYRDGFGASSATNKAAWNYRKPRVNNNWKKELWQASDQGMKYRSNNAYSYALNTANQPGAGTVAWIPCISDSTTDPYWTALGGLVTSNDTGPGPTFGGKFFIRGGLSMFVFTNLTSRPVMVRTWRMRTTPAGVLPGPFTADMGWDPSLPNQELPVTSIERDVWKNYKFWGNMDVLVEVGKSFERSSKIPAARCDPDQHNGRRSRDFWVFFVQNPWDATVVTPGVVVSHNLTFTGDRT